MRAGAALCAALLVAAAGSQGPAEDLKELRSRIQRLQKQLAESEETRSEAADALRESERAVSDTNRRLFQLAAEERAARGRLERIAARQTALQRRVRAQQQLVAQLVFRQYMSGPSEPLRLMLERQDPNELARRLHYLSYVYRARAEVIDALKRDLGDLSRLSDQVRDEQRELESLQADYSRNRAQLERERGKRQAVLAKVSADVSRQRRAIGTLKRDEARLSRLVRKLAQELQGRVRAPVRRPAERAREQGSAEGNAAAEFRDLKGRLRLPVQGELANRFGAPRAGGGPDWKGLLIRARSGEQVHAVAAGQVVFADWLRGFGNLLILDHGDGYLSLYGYNESLLKEVGDGVGAGEPIGTVGSTGGSSETGLYFEIRYQGRPIDPLRWVASK